MDRYRKLIVALLGFAAVAASSFGLPELAGAEDEAVAVVNAVATLLTALGVYRVPNATAGPVETSNLR